MPDIFVPEDTTGYTSYYVNVMNKGLIQKFALSVADKYRSMLDDVKSTDRLLKVLPRDNTLLENFVSFAVKNGVPARWYYIKRLASQPDKGNDRTRRVGLFLVYRIAQSRRQGNESGLRCS